MNIASVNNIKFSSQYKVNPHQLIVDRDFANLRNDYLSVWAEKAYNANEISEDLSILSINPYGTITYDLPDKFDKSFEKDMKSVGQKFLKIK